MASDFLKLFVKAAKALTSREKIIVIGLLLVFSFSTAGLFWTIGSSIEQPSNVTKEGGTYNEGLVGSLKSLNPLFSDFSNVDRSINRLVYSGLTKYDPLTKSFVADLATYELSEDKKKYTFTIREGVKWHDGSDLTADDVLFTYSDIIQSDEFPNSILRANFAGIDIQKEAENQVSFTLDEPNTFFITNTNVGIIPRHVYEKFGAGEIAQADVLPVGSGPYKLSAPPNRGTEETLVELEKFDDFYNELPKFEKVRFKIYPYQELLVDNFSHLHAVEKLSESDLGTIEEETRLEKYQFELPQYMAVFFNFDSPLMKNKQLRIAAMKAVNRDEILAQIPGKTPVDNPLLDLDQSEWFFKHNLEESQGALYGLGWRIPDSSLIESSAATENAESQEAIIRENKDGDRLVLRLITQELPTGGKSQIEQQKLISLLKKHWADAGIEVRDEYYILPELQERIKQSDYDMLLSGVNMGYNLDIYANWHSSQAIAGGLNFSKYKSFEADALIENIRQTFEASPEHGEQLNKLRKVIADDFPAVFLYTPKYFFVADERIGGIDIRNLSFSADRFAYFDKWYIKE